MVPKLRIPIVLCALLLVGCAAGPGSDWAKTGADAAGFFAGLWHGVLLVITLIVSFFTDQVRIYEVHNSGVGYDIGFVLGVLAISGSGVKVSTSRPGRKSGWSRTYRYESGNFADELERRVDREEEWKELGPRLEKRIKDKLRRWLDEEDRKEQKQSGDDDS